MGFLPGEIWKPQVIYPLLGPYNSEYPHVDIKLNVIPFYMSLSLSFSV